MVCKVSKGVTCTHRKKLSLTASWCRGGGRAPGGRGADPRGDAAGRGGRAPGGRGSRGGGRAPATMKPVYAAGKPAPPAGGDGPQALQQMHDG